MPNPTVPKKNNNTKYGFTGTSIKKQVDEKLQMEDEKLLHSYDMEAGEFLDHITFDSTDFEDDEIDYVEESI